MQEFDKDIVNNIHAAFDDLEKSLDLARLQHTKRITRLRAIGDRVRLQRTQAVDQGVHSEGIQFPRPK